MVLRWAVISCFIPQSSMHGRVCECCTILRLGHTHGTRHTKQWPQWLARDVAMHGQLTSFIRESSTAPNAGSASPPPAAGENFSTWSAISSSRAAACCMQATTVLGTADAAIVENFVGREASQTMGHGSRSGLVAVLLMSTIDLGSSSHVHVMWRFKQSS